MKMASTTLSTAKISIISCLSTASLALNATAQNSTPALGSEAVTQRAAGTNRPLQLPKDSPFFDPNIIYLEADELIDDEKTGILTAQGEVEGRYQDRTLRADKVLYTLDTGRVIATGNVVLIDASGATQYADKLELSDTLEAGTASNFTARFPQGGILGSKFVTRNTGGEGVELYNAYYTACEACNENGEPKKPTWRIRARKVTQNPDKNYIQYRDAVVEFKGIPLLYTPYLSHPDPSAERASGWLNPFVGISGSRGFNFRTPYYFALDDHSELTLTPHIATNVNPLIEADYRRLFHSGEINVNTSLTYATPFDNDGNIFSDPTLFTNPDEATTGRRLRSHFFANGLFDINNVWQWGFGAQAASDDLFLKRYDLEERPERFGLYEAASRRLVSQAFVVGQDENFRFATSAYGFQSLRTSIIENGNDPAQLTVFREDDSTLPIIAPKIELEHYFTDPVLGGRLKTSADTTVLTRKIGTDYIRASGGLDWSKNFIAPGGIEIKPFANGRYDYFEIEPEDLSADSFERTLGQAGVDIRWPFIKPGKGVDFIIEPRVQITQSFGDGKLENFSRIDNSGNEVSLFQDSLDIDLDQALFWSSNKSTGFDFWQEGFRADLGASFIADWQKGRAHVFIGQSYASGFDDSFALGSGLAGDKSDIIGLFELELGRNFRSTTRVRYDDDDNTFSRIDSGLRYSNNRFSLDARYFRLDSAARFFTTEPGAPTEEISGGVTLNLAKNWSTRYRATHDIDLDTTRRQSLSLIYDDDCTRVELIYRRNRNNLGVVGNNSGLGIRVSLLTLGDFSDQ